MLGSLLAYDSNGVVIATLSHMVSQDENGNVTGLVDFEQHEINGDELTDIWKVDSAVGSKTWPEWLGSRAHEFKVELDGPPGRKRIKALIHVGRPEITDDSGVIAPAVPGSGHRRERSNIEKAIQDRIKNSNEPAVYIGDILGGPEKPITLDSEGKNAEKIKIVRPTLPSVSL